MIAPHIGYSCHDAMMEEMELLVEACNTPPTTTTTTTTPGTYPTIDYTTGTTDYFYPTTIDTPIINVINNATGSVFLSFIPDYFICEFFVSDGIIESPNYPENYPNNYDEVR